MSRVSNNKTSILVSGQVPQFVRDDHALFVEFLEYYYKFLEDRQFIKARLTDLKISTSSVGDQTGKTNIVQINPISGNNFSEIINGRVVSVNGFKTKIVDASDVANTRIFNVDPKVPARIVEGDFFVYDTVYSPKGSDLSNITKNLARYMDIDVSADDNSDLRQKFYDNFIKAIPANLKFDKELMIKHAKEFYRSRGSENSVRFLLRALFGTEAEFYYPKTDVLRASDGKWYVEKALRITDTAVNGSANNSAFGYFRGRTIRGEVSRAVATVEGVDIYYRKGELITELKISNSVRPFLSNELITTQFEEDGLVKTASAKIFGGQIVDTDVLVGGTGYVEGMEVPLINTSNTGEGGKIIVSRVTRGGINRIFVSAGLPENGGAGYAVDDLVFVTGGGGTGAFGGVEAVWENIFHPNTYNIVATTIESVAGVHLNDYDTSSEVVEAVDENGDQQLFVNYDDTVANTKIGDAVRYWQWANTGAVKFIYVVEEGQDYIDTPSFTVEGNTHVRGLGSLGKILIRNPGRGYQVGDHIEFINRPLSYGTGAAAEVTSVDANGAITGVYWKQIPGHQIGGAGYNPAPDRLPIARVISATGTGANINVDCTLVTGGKFTYTTESLGILRALKIISEGNAYTSAPIIDLSSLGDGTAQATCTVVTGIYAYPGRYLNDDGFLSAQNFLQDKDYYQNFSYEIKSGESIAKYRKTLKELTHPAGTKMFGRYLYEDVEQSTMNASSVFSSWYNLNVLTNGLVFHVDSANNSGSVVGKWKNLANNYTQYTGDIYNVEIRDGVLPLDGTNEHAVFPNYAALNTNTLTIEVWAEFFTSVQDAMILEKGFVNSQYSLMLEKNRLIFRGMLNGTLTNFINLNASNTLIDNRWNHITATFTNGRQNLYVNGKLAGTATYSGTLATNSYGITLGTSGPIGGNPIFRTYYMEGYLSQARIYNRVLSVSDINRNFRTSSARFGYLT